MAILYLNNNGSVANSLPAVASEGLVVHVASLPDATLSTTGATTYALSANITTATTTALKTAVAATKVRVYRLVVSTSAAQNLSFKSATTIISPTFYLPANGTLTLDLSTEPWLTCATNEALNITNSAVGNLTVAIWYTQAA